MVCEPWWSWLNAIATHQCKRPRLPDGREYPRLIWTKSLRPFTRQALYKVAAVPTADDVRVDEESVRLRLIALVIKEMNRDGEAVTVTNRRRPVAVLSTVPASEETHSAFVGMMVSVASGRL